MKALNVIELYTLILYFICVLPQLKYFYINIHTHTYIYKTSLVAQMVKCLPTVRETWVRSLGWEDLLEKEMATHSSTLTWKISWTEKPGVLRFMGSQRVRHD